MEEKSKNGKAEEQTPHYDLSEVASRRPEGTAATNEARQQESDDINGEAGNGQVDRPHDSGLFGSNKMPTSLDDE